MQTVRPGASRHDGPLQIIDAADLSALPKASARSSRRSATASFAHADERHQGHEHCEEGHQGKDEVLHDGAY
jgi:hypothetical protein